MQRKHGLQLGRPSGLPLRIHGSWFPAGALLAAHLAVSAYGALDLVPASALGLATAVVFFACVAIHTYAHAGAARVMQRPLASATIYPFGDTSRFARPPTNPRQEVAIALAGPITSALFGAAFLVGSSFTTDVTADLLSTLGLANLILAAINLLPAAPLDGARFVSAYFWTRRSNPTRGERWSKRLGQLSGVALLAVGTYLATRRQLTVIQDAPAGLWLGLSGLFLLVRASFTPPSPRTVVDLNGVAVGTWARPFAGRVDADAPAPTTGGPFAVSDNGRLAGIVLPRTYNAADVRVRDVMLPWTPDMTLDASTPLEQGLARLRTTPGGIVVVLDDRGVVRGVLDEDIVRAQLQTT